MAYMIGTNGEAFQTSNPEWHKDAKQVTKKVWLIARKKYCAKQIKKFVKPGSKVFVKCDHVSRSGMMRHLDLYATHKGELIRLTGYAADLLDYRTTDRGALKVGGCGMDMGFAVVYELGRALWPKGTSKPHGTRNGEPDTCGGYALKHSWM